MMDAAAPGDGGLAAIVGLHRPTLEPILARHSVSIAIVDDVDSFVVGGRRTGLDAACQEAAARRASHTISLKVALPSHTHFLGKATEKFRAVLREASARLPRAGYRLLSGIDGDTIHDIETGIDKLARQISTTIDRAACRKLPISRHVGGFGTRSRNRSEPHGIGAVSRWPHPRGRGIPELGRSTDMAAASDGLTSKENEVVSFRC